MKIREADRVDAQKIARVHVDSWRTTYKGILPDEFLARLSYDQRTALWESNMLEQTVYVAESTDGDIVGFSTGGKKKSKNYDAYQGELYAIYILEEYQGKGIGKLLMQPIVKELADLKISNMMVLVLEDNSSKHFYKALGANKIDTLIVNIAGTVVNELVYGWVSLNFNWRLTNEK